MLAALASPASALRNPIRAIKAAWVAAIRWGLGMEGLQQFCRMCASGRARIARSVRGVFAVISASRLSGRFLQRGSYESGEGWSSGFSQFIHYLAQAHERGIPWSGIS